MANDIKRISIGSATISRSAYVTAGGAGTFADVGYLDAPATIEMPMSNYRMMAESLQGAIRAIPIDFGVKLKFAMKESLQDTMAWVLRQGAATGTTPNFTLLIGDPTEQYNQMKVVGKGGRLTATGADATETWTFWRGAVESMDPIGFAKDKERILLVTIDCLYDETVSTADKYGKVIAAGGA